jgi:arginine decarboxylase
MRRRNLIGSVSAYLAGSVALLRGGSAARGEDLSKVRPAGDSAAGLRPLVPTRMFVTSAVSANERRAWADDTVLCGAGIGNCNRVEVSSIIPPGCKIIAREEGLKLIKDGQILFAVLGKTNSATPGMKIATALGFVIPEDGGTGFISEAVGEDPDLDPAYVARRAAEAAMGMYAMRMGLSYDPHKEFDPSKEVYKIGGRTVRVTTASTGATVDPSGKHTFVLTSAVFLF